MKVLLVYPHPSVNKECRFGYSLNLLYLASLLREAGYAPEYIDFSLDVQAHQKLQQSLGEAAAVIVEIDSFPLKRSENAPHAEALIRKIRRHYPFLPLVACGYDCIVNPRNIPDADYTYTYEPETTIVQLIQDLSQGLPIHLTFKDASPLNDLDILPFPARDLIPDRMARGGTATKRPLARSALIQTSRGCPGACRFCQRKGWYKGARYHSVDYVVAEFAALQANQVVNVWITDDNFGSHVPRAKDIFKTLADSGVSQNMHIALSTWTKIDAEFLELAKKAGVRIISLGLESASEKILEFYGKPIDLDQARRLITYADSLGIFTVANFILGAPMESEETIKATFQFALSLPIDEVNVKILTYMPGSVLFDQLPDHLKTKRAIFACQENGLNIFKLADLRRAISQFYRQFKALRGPRLFKKIAKYGPPYAIDTSYNHISSYCTF